MKEDQKPNNDLNGTKSDGRVPAALASPFWFLISFSLTGFAAGYFTGMSESPVVATLLPLLFGLIGGGGVIFLVKADLSQSVSRGRVRVLAAAAAVFALACMSGAVFGSSARSGVGLEDYLPTWTGRGMKTAEAMKKMATQEAVNYFVLKTKLQALGASDEEAKQILDRAAQINSQRRALDPKSLTTTLEKVARVEEDLQKLTAIKPTTEEETAFIRNVSIANRQSAFVVRTLRYWIDHAFSQTPINDDSDAAPDSSGESITNFMQTLRDMRNEKVMVTFSKKANVSLSDFDELPVLLEQMHEPADIYVEIFRQIDPSFDLLGKIKGNAKETEHGPHLKK
jgi:hypothetical protein